MASVSPPDDRTYLYFMITGLLIALAGGFVLAVVAPLAATGVLPYEEKSQLLIQAHGWAQLVGFAGVIVAGMALRLIPRFAGVPPPRVRLAAGALVLLSLSAIVRMIAQPWIDGDLGEALLLIAGVAGSVGMVLVAAMLFRILTSGKRPRDPWRDFARAGAAWWLVWAVLSSYAVFQAVDEGRYVPLRIEDDAAWVAMLGVIASFIWAVQSRSVPVFYGRKSPRRKQVIVPFALLQGGLALTTASIFLHAGEWSWRLEGAGLASTGAAFVWLAPVAGSVWGRAKRLRPRARMASRNVLVANWSALGAGLLLVWAGIDTVLAGQYEAFWARDSARHLIALGTITILILGMAQLLTPVFALERAESRRLRFRDEAIFWLLVLALLTRVSSGLLADVTSYDLRMRHAAYAGIFAWAGLALFAWRLRTAIRREPEMKALLGFKEAGS
ncbi:MAG TPA: NnrS family protein [Tepidiformaceae bacterium]|nr:NnrS family protein [Tepidiformaceae bacterium]